jgi:NADH-ubiquinone oxidoreductase chain 3
MFYVFVMVLIRLILVIFLKIVSLYLSESVSISRESLSSYECGFEHHNVSRVPFSLRYFFLTLLFLLFDLEVVLLLMCPFFIFSFRRCLVFLLMLLFLVILFLSLIYEWNDGTLE